jgi:hypothetical protein
VEISSNTSYVSCFGKSGDLDGSRFARSPVLVSPDGQFRAYAEVEAVAFKPIEGKGAYAGPLCANTSRLLVNNPHSEAFVVVLLQEPTRWKLGNAIRLVDWSPDNHLLLVDLTIWQYESDVIGKNIVIYDTRFGTFTIPDYSRIFRERFGKQCFVDIELKGFSAEGNVVLRVGPVDEEFEGPSCVDQQGLWVLDPNGDKASPLAHDYHVQRYGRFEERPVVK